MSDRIYADGGGGGYFGNLGGGGDGGSVGAESTFLLKPGQTRAPEFFGQDTDAACGLAVVQNALKQLNKGVAPITSSDLVKLLNPDQQARLLDAGLYKAEITQLFNDAAKKLGLGFQATVVTGSDRNDLTFDATRSGNLYITLTRTSGGLHAELNIPMSDTNGSLSGQVRVISSTTAGAIQFTSWGSDRGNALVPGGDRPVSDPLYSIIVINPVPTVPPGPG